MLPFTGRDKAINSILTYAAHHETRRNQHLVIVVCIALCGFCLPMDAADPPSASIVIDAAKVVGHVDPKLYGAFTELMAEGVKYGLDAEMLHDRSFEETPDALGLPRGWQLEPDERNDNVGAIRFAQVPDEAYPRTNRASGKPDHSLRVTLTPGDIMDARRGLSQPHINVRYDTDYTGYLWLKVPAGEHAYRGSITVALEEDSTGGATYASTPISGISGDWKQYFFRLHPGRMDAQGKLSILFDGRGVLWMDQASLMPADAVGRVRKDVSSRIRELRPTFVRWPGGNVAQDYHWEWGIGPRDQRPSWLNVAWSNATEPSDFGTDEYIAFCRTINAEPSITVNVEGAGATAEEAAHWVEYVNGPATSKYGAMRASNGHPEPYHVTLWELGNEIFGDWVRGHVNAETYARSAKRYAQAMRAVDPNIRLIAVGQNDGKTAADWNATVIKIMGKDIDLLAVHDYTGMGVVGNDPTRMMATTLEFEKLYHSMHEMIAQISPEHPIPFVVNEWNLFFPSDVIQSMDGGVYAARMMNAFERSGEQVEMSSVSDLVNGWVGGIIQASRDRIYVTPQFYVTRMYSDHLGTDRLASEITSSSLDAPASNPTIAEKSIAAIDAVVTRSTDGKHIYVKVANADPHRAITTSISVHGTHISREAEEQLLAAPTNGRANSFAEPDVVHPISTHVHCGGACSIRLPAASVAVITLDTR